MTTQNFIDYIKEKTRCLDGGMGSMLFKLGFTGGCPEQAPEEIIRQIHLNYLKAGSQIITTNTFGGSKLKLDKYGFGDKVKEINIRNTKAACSIKFDKEYYVAGDIGPTGEFLEPFGDYTYEQFVEIFSEQAQSLAEGGADAIIIETMMSIDEYKAACEASKKSTNLPVIACMTFNKNPNGFFTMGGNTPKQMIETAKELHVDVVGANCNLNPIDMVSLAEELTKLSDVPVVVQPNAGNPKLVDGKTFYELVPNLEEYLIRMIKAGVSILGGCCGTDENYIRTLRKLIDEVNC